ncbi:hypothetical protein [Kushneria aurantia]|uniref:Uncharacterized protein n=1 Tax=Kushneria aurantia TaxID=504092 RepID=A0ABV6FYG2_9GAMM|nr:hypothetical protein [Kushneria aurantia]
MTHSNHFQPGIDARNAAFFNRNIPKKQEIISIFQLPWHLKITLKVELRVDNPFLFSRKTYRNNLSFSLEEGKNGFNIEKYSALDSF